MRPGPTLWPHFTFITSLKTHLQYSHILRNWGPGLQPVNLGDTTQPDSRPLSSSRHSLIKEKGRKKWPVQVGSQFWGTGPIQPPAREEPPP